MVGRIVEKRREVWLEGKGGRKSRGGLDGRKDGRKRIRGFVGGKEGIKRKRGLVDGKEGR